MTPITRRAFIAAGTAALASTALGASKTESPPNVLFILTDEQSLWTLGVYGGKLPGTPNIDSIGKEGAIFRNFFVTSAVCTPSRGCYMTGRYPHSHGAVHNDLPLHPDEFTLGHMFQRAGYETGYAGKWHLDGKNDPTWPDWIPSERSFGFDDHKWMFNQGHWKRIEEHPEGWPNNRSVATASENFDGNKVENNTADRHNYVSAQPDGRPNESYSVTAKGEYFSDWLTDKAVEFIRRPRTSPFFYVLSFSDPHSPFTVESKYSSMFPRESMKLPVTFHQKNLPAWAEKMRLEDLKREGVSSEDDPRREKVFQERKAEYLGMVKCIDDNVGRILNTLRELQTLDNTLIIFASDHGQYMGEHGIYFKNALYEPAHHVGMLMRWPKGIRPGTVINECVANVDLLPTLAGLLTLKTAGREQGRDASPLIRRERADWKNEAFIHKDYFTQSGVFTQEWELGLDKGGDSVLFDRKRDPLQVNNLYNDPQCKAVVDELTDRTMRHNEKVGSPALKWLSLLQQGKTQTQS
jgi:arylsulfatase A-like enzyme